MQQTAGVLLELGVLLAMDASKGGTATLPCAREHNLIVDVPSSRSSRCPMNLRILIVERFAYCRCASRPPTSTANLKTENKTVSMILYRYPQGRVLRRSRPYKTVDRTTTDL
jgi:hypothetical protein